MWLFIGMVIGAAVLVIVARLVYRVRANGDARLRAELRDAVAEDAALAESARAERAEAASTAPAAQVESEPEFYLDVTPRSDAERDAEWAAFYASNGVAPLGSALRAMQDEYALLDEAEVQRRLQAELGQGWVRVELVEPEKGQ